MTETRPIRVLIVDDHSLLRGGIISSLEVQENFEVVGEAGNGLEAIRRCKEVQPDVILMDVLMPEMDGITAIRNIMEICPGTRIIALTSSTEEEHVQAALEAGAISYLLKNVSVRELAGAIRDAYHGRSTLSQEATQVLIRATHRTDPSDFGLTERERDVLQLLTQGMRNEDIAQKLMISTSTAKKHVRNILSKLNALNRTEAVSIALQHKLVEQ